MPIRDLLKPADGACGALFGQAGVFVRGSPGLPRVKRREEVTPLE
jgi:hypothetical protein